MLVASAIAPAPARAETQRSHHAIRLDGHGSIGWYGDLSVGFRVEFPIVPDGLVDGVDDELSLSPGLDFLWFYHPDFPGVGIYPLVMAQWNFYLGERWSVFPELGATLIFAEHRDRYWRTFIAPVIAAGGRYHFSDRLALLVRVGWPVGLSVGLVFSFP